jgi:hypothetical protein
MAPTANRIGIRWCALTGGLLAILLATQVSLADGFRRVGPEIQIAPGGVLWNLTSYNPDADQYLVLWEQYGGPHVVQRGRCVDASTGTFAGPEFQVAVWVGMGGVVYNHDLGCWFVVYFTDHDSGGDIFGQKVGVNGNIGDPIPMVTADGDQMVNTIAYDPVRKRYLIAWTNYQDPAPDIHAQLFNQNGGPVAGLSWFQVSEYTLKSQTTPLSAYNPACDEFLVVWADLRNDIYRTNPNENNNNYTDMYGQRIRAGTGELIGANLPVATPFVPGRPYVGDGLDVPYAVVCNTQAASSMYGTYFVGDQKLSDLGWTTLGLILDAQGNHYSGRDPFYISHPLHGGAAGTVYSPLDDAYVTTYHDANNEVAAQQFSTTGDRLLGPTEMIVHPDWEENYGSLAVRPGDRQYLQVTVLFENFITHERPWTLIAQRFIRDQVPPPPVTGFAAAAGPGQNRLSWNNPVAADDFTGTVIRYSTSGYPTGPTDGQLLVDQANSPGSSDSCVHLHLAFNTRYYYAAFAHDGAANYSQPVQATAVPSYPGGDFDGDSDVDQDDFGHLQRCLSGEGLPYAQGCEDADGDCDGDVDQVDLGGLLGCMAGANVPPGC